MNCPFCDQPGKFLWSGSCADIPTPGDFKTYRCPACGAGWTTPLLDTNQAKIAPDQGGQLSFLIRIFLKERVSKIRSFLKKGKLLDVGCGLGWFVSMFKTDKKIRAVGFEPSEKSVERGTHELGITIHTGPFKEAFPENEFDVVTLWHVLEHIPNLDEMLKEIRRILKREGKLFLSVPNFESWQARWTGKNWVYLDIPRHIWQFSPQALQELLQKNGFVLQKTFRHSWEYGPYGWFQSLLNLIGERNYLYHKLKKGRSYQSLKPLRRFGNNLWSFLIGPLLFALPSVLLSIGESLVDRGSVLEAVAPLDRIPR